VAGGRLDRPGAAERTAHAELCPRFEAGQRARDLADVADGVDQVPGALRIAADADRDLADARQVEHVELAGREVEQAAVGGLEVERPGVGELAAPAQDLRHRRDHRVGVHQAAGLA
jgi:hypothetical protein